MTRGLSFAVCVGCLVVEGCRGGGWEDFENRLMNQFERSDIVALGEFHGSEDDAEI